MMGFRRERQEQPVAALATASSVAKHRCLAGRKAGCIAHSNFCKPKGIATRQQAGGPEMNRLLSGTVGFLNGLLAIILVIGGAVSGTAFTHAVVGFIVGGIIGLILAAIICGFLALVIEIRSELVRIREALERGNSRPG
jgi:uncharacterized membrane protein